MPETKSIRHITSFSLEMKTLSEDGMILWIGEDLTSDDYLGVGIRKGWSIWSGIWAGFHAPSSPFRRQLSKLTMAIGICSKSTESGNLWMWKLMEKFTTLESREAITN